MTKKIMIYIDGKEICLSPKTYITIIGLVRKGRGRDPIRVIKKYLNVPDETLLVLPGWDLYKNRKQWWMISDSDVVYISDFIGKAKAEIEHVSLDNVKSLDKESLIMLNDALADLSKIQQVLVDGLHKTMISPADLEEGV